MRRRNPVSVRVKAPSRGLVTRLPTELADTLKPGDAQRTFVAASNVRFEDGVLANAPGYSLLTLQADSAGLTNLLNGLVSHFALDSLANTRSQPKQGGGEEGGELPIVVPGTLSDTADSSSNGYGLSRHVDSVFYNLKFPPSAESLGLVPGKFSNALTLGSSKYLLHDNTSGAFSGPGDLSVSGWFKLGSSAGSLRLVGLGGIKDVNGSALAGVDYDAFGQYVVTDAPLSWEVRIVGTQLRAFVQTTGGWTGAPGNGSVFNHSESINLGVWNFFCLSIDAENQIQLTLNGTTQTWSYTSLIYYATPKLYFGGMTTGTEPAVVLDSVSFWKGVALLPEQAASLYASGAGLQYPFFGKSVFITQGNVLQTDPYPLIIGTDKNLYLVNKSYTGSEFSASLSPVYTVPANVSVSVGSRWSSCDFYDKFVFAQASCPPQYYFGGTTTTDVPGLPDNQSFDGCTAFQNHLLLWKDTTLYWSDLNNLGLWIPVAETIFSSRFTLSSAFAQPAASSTTSGYVYLNEDTTGLTVDQFVVVEEPSKASFNVSGATNASPIVLTTSSNHSYVVGDKVSVTGVTGNLAANGNWVVTAVGANTVTLGSSQGSANYLSGGTVQRIPFVNYYTVTEVTPTAGAANYVLAPCSGAANQTIAGGGSVSTLFPSTLVEWEVGTHATIGAGPEIAVVKSVATSPVPAGVPYFTVRASAPFNTSTIDVEHTNTGLTGSDYVSISSDSGPGVDVFQVTQVELVQPSAGVTFTRLSVTKLNIGTNVKTFGSYSTGGSYVVWTPHITVTNAGAAVTINSSTLDAGRTLTRKHGVKLRTEALTGRRMSGNVPAGRTLLTLDANEAGSSQIVGASDNGDIYQVVPLGDYAVVFKNRTVQAMQYVGRLSGTFFIRTELRDEGLLGRNSVVRVNDNRLVFLGNREMYDYRGGSNLTPVCQQFTRTLYSELDRSRVDEVLLHHREQRNEVWVLYPVSGGQRVLVWNYVEDTVSLDDYRDRFSYLTAVAQTRWGWDPRWIDFEVTTTWEKIGQDVRWMNLVGSGEEQVTLMASAEGDLVMHGTGYSRDGNAYPSSAETQDHDFGDADAWKYVDAVVLQLDVRDATPDIVKTLYVEVGTKDTLDGVVTWSAPKPVYVQGSGQRPTKINPGGAGRYVRLRFSSNAADCNWRVSGYEIHARRGGTY